MSDITKFFDAAHRLAHRIRRLVPPGIKNAMLTEMCDALRLEPMARAEHQALVRESKKNFKELRSLEWILLHSTDYRIPGVIALPLKIYSEESGEDETYTTYYEAAISLGMEDCYVKF